MQGFLGGNVRPGTERTDTFWYGYRRTLAAEDVKAYLCKVVNRWNLQDWQYFEMVDALRILFKGKKQALIYLIVNTLL